MRKTMMVQAGSPDEKENKKNNDENKQYMIQKWDSERQEAWGLMGKVMHKTHLEMKNVNELSKDYLQLAADQYVENFEAMRFSSLIHPNGMPNAPAGFLKVTLNSFITDKSDNNKTKQDKVHLTTRRIRSPWKLTQCLNASGHEDVVQILHDMIKAMQNSPEDSTNNMTKTLQSLEFTSFLNKISEARIMHIDSNGIREWIDNKGSEEKSTEKSFIKQIEGALRRDSWMFFLGKDNKLTALSFSLSAHNVQMPEKHEKMITRYQVNGWPQKLMDEAIKVYSRRVIHVQLWEMDQALGRPVTKCEIVAQTQHADVGFTDTKVYVEDSVTECIEIRMSDNRTTDRPEKENDPLVFRQGVYVNLDLHPVKRFRTSTPAEKDDFYTRITCLQMGVARLYMQKLQSHVDSVPQGIAEKFTAEKLEQLQNIVVKSCIIKNVKFHAEDGSILDAVMMTSRVCVEKGEGTPVSQLRIRTVYVLSSRKPVRLDENDDWEDKTMDKMMKETYSGKTQQPHYNVWHPNLKPTPGSENYMFARVGGDEEEDHWTLRGQIVQPELPSRAGSKKGKTASFLKGDEFIGLGIRRAMKERMTQVQSAGSGFSPHTQIANLPKKGLSSSTASQPAVRALPKRVVLR